MNRKLSYIDINNQDLKSLYKLYYTNKLAQHVGIEAKSKLRLEKAQESDTTSFIFYGTMIAITPIKRIEFNKVFNEETEKFKVDLSIIPYSNFKSRIRFSNLNDVKVRLKGDMLFQMEAIFDNKPFASVKTVFEKQMDIYICLFSTLSKHMNKMSPLIVYIPNNHDLASNKISSTIDAKICIRYNFRNKWVNRHNQDKQIGLNLIYIITSPQRNRMAVIIYNQSKKILFFDLWLDSITG